MKKKIIIVIFISFATLLAVALISRIFIFKPQTVSNKARNVIPLVADKDNKSYVDNSQYSEESEMTSFIPLNADETLLGVISMDFDGDTFEDQVNVVKTSDSQNIKLIVGLYNDKKKSYERMSVIETNITQFKTFSYTGLDLSGKHKNALIYQGFTDDGLSVLKAFHIYKNNKGFSLVSIADFEADGTIFIQQLDRYDAYERLNANGSPYPIWVYTSDVLENPNSTDQLQICYTYNEDEDKYVKLSQVRVAGNKVAAKELARIQDGTVETFANYLKGLWYKTENEGSSVHYIFFDYENQEIIFLVSETEEVYNWQTSNLRRNGMYISATNQEIQNLQRRVDISLLGQNRLSVSIVDDLRMLIGENNLWNGEYKRVVFAYDEKDSVLNKNSLEYVKDLEKGPSWKASDGSSVSFRTGQYAVSNESISDGGDYTYIDADGNCFIQFRSKKELPYFKGTYKISYAKITQSDSRSKKKQIEYNKDSIILEPYTLTPQGSYAADGRIVILSRNSD